MSSKKIQHVLIVYRPSTSQAYQISQELVHWLKTHKVKSYIGSEQRAIPGASRIASAALSKIQLCVVIGGDGTYLNAVRRIDGHKIPVLGFNLGALGFMTESRQQDLYAVLELALKNKLKTEARTLLEVQIKKQGAKPTTYFALNDLVLERGPISRLINLAIYCENDLVSELKADGLIVSTPTGSTAYNMAAGGPILHPEVEALVVTPICAHSLSNRPITLPDHKTITIKVNKATQKAVFMVDGQKCGRVQDQDEVLIKRSKRVHVRLVPPNTSYLSVLRTKLKFGQRE